MTRRADERARPHPRRFATVAFDDAEVAATSVVGEVGAAGDAVDWQLRVAIAVQLAEMVGAMQRALDMTIEWSFDRYSFGRPLASYQELKHRFADMKLWLESSHAIADARGARRRRRRARRLGAAVGREGLRRPLRASS